MKRSENILQQSKSAVGQQSSILFEKHSRFTLHVSPFTTYFLNGHGEVIYFADANFTEEEIETYEYSPWGVLLTSASKNNLLYTAREFDFETGLQLNRMRYYNPNLGRFFKKDFIFLDNNYYEYVGNSPTVFKDPFGLLPPWIGRHFWVNIVLPGSLPIGWCIEPECGCSCEDLPNYYLCFAACYCKEDYQWRWCICCPYA